MSEEPKTAETNVEDTSEKTEKKSWFNRVWSAVLGILVGAATMFGVNQTQIATIKNDAAKAIQEVKTTVEAIQNKQYLDAIEAGKNAISTLQTIAGEAKEAADVVKDAAEEYKADVVELKAAINAKDYEKAVSTGAALLAKITEKIPADSLTGKTKEVYDLVNQIVNDINDKKYDPVIELIKKLSGLFAKKGAEVPAEIPAEEK